MALSTLTAFALLAEGSEATPGLFNRVFSQLSDNIASVNVQASGTSIAAPASSAGSALLSLHANSNLTDYIYFHDTSNQRSNYLLGSHTSTQIDGLNLFDVSGDTLIVNFSKQSVRFYAPVVGQLFDTGGSIFNVQTFGAAGDGVTDDTAAIQNAINFANGRTIYLPAGTYKITSSLSRVNRSAGTNIAGLKLLGDGMYQTIIDSRVTNGFAIVCDSTVTTVFQWAGFVKNMSIQGHPGSPLGGGIAVTCSWDFSIENVQITSMRSDAIRVPTRPDLSSNVDNYASQFMMIRGCRIEGNQGWGFNGEGGIAFSGQIDSCYIGNNFWGGVYLGGGNSAVRHCTIFSSGVSGNGGVEVIGSITGTKISSNEFDSNHSYDIYSPSGLGAEISDNRFIAVPVTGVLLQPPKGMVLEDTSGYLVRGNYSRTSTSGETQPYTAYTLLAPGANNVLIDNLMPPGNNTSGLVRYSNSGASNIIVERGALIDLSVTSTTTTGGLVVNSQATALSLNVGTGDAVYATLVANASGSGAISIPFSLQNLGATANGTGAQIRFLAKRNNGDTQDFTYMNHVVVGKSVGGEMGRIVMGGMVQGSLVDNLILDQNQVLMAQVGSALTPASAFSSERSLGFYRSGASTIAQSYGTFLGSAVWSTSGISVGNSTAGGSLIPAISSTSSKIGAFVVQGSASSFTIVTWAAAQPNDIILVTPTSLGAAVSSLSSGLVAHSHCTKAGQVEVRLSNCSTLAQNQSSITWFLTRVSPF